MYVANLTQWGKAFFFYHFLCTSMETFTKIRPPLAVANLGEGSKLRPEGPKKKNVFGDRASPLSQGLDDHPLPLPPYLNVLIHH